LAPGVSWAMAGTEIAAISAIRETEVLIIVFS
jgi:hypothetical protein